MTATATIKIQMGASLAIGGGTASREFFLGIDLL